ncbi:hypothetical protein HHI36_002624 [Cryptolaemus montrouzieri]|uniref:Uncharacterized protein n=1 Tax=Cryptolaemus montrouzieri TaxID=559131 RepID=A0ABD2PBR9_9CUCU
MHKIAQVGISLEVSKSVSNEGLRDLIREIQRRIIESKRKLLDKLEESHSTVVQLEEENRYLRDKIESKDKKNNLIVSGLQVDPERNLDDSIGEGLNEKLDLKLSTGDLNNVYIVGKKPNGPIKLELTSYLRKTSIIRTAHKLRGTQVNINNDL